MPRSRTPAGETDTPGALVAPPARQPRGTAAGPGCTAPRVRVEFIVEPFVEGRLGPHVRAAVGSLRREGLEPDVGPFGTALEGEAAPVLDAVARAAAASFGAGASGFTLHAIAEAEPEPAEEDEEGLDAFLAALDPVARAIGGSIVAPGAMSRAAVPLRWKGRLVGGLERPPPNDLRNGLAATVAAIETQLGRGLAELDRVGKQRAVRMLDEVGAFAIRNAVDDVADAMGVSRVTVYNYLNATRAGAPVARERPGGGAPSRRRGGPPRA